MTSFLIQDKMKDNTTQEPILLEGNLTMVSWMGCAFTAIVCLINGLVITGYRLMKNIRSYIRMGFLIMLGTVESVFLVGMRYADVPGLCTMIAIWLHFAVISSFCWILVYALFLGNELKGKHSYNKLPMIAYSMLGWMVPFLLVLISIIWRYTDYRDHIYCWTNTDEYMRWATIGPIAVISVAALLIILYDVKLYFHKTDEKFKARHVVDAGGLRSCCFILPCHCATWLFGCFAVIEQTLWLEICFSVSNCILGMMIFLFMCLFNEEVIQARKSAKTQIKKNKVDISDVDNMPRPKAKVYVSSIVLRSTQMSTAPLAGDGRQHRPQAIERPIIIQPDYQAVLDDQYPDGKHSDSGGEEVALVHRDEKSTHEESPTAKPSVSDTDI